MKFIFFADSIGPEVPQILINRELLRNKNFDINLLGDCDVIVNEISRRLELDEFKSLYDENNKYFRCLFLNFNYSSYFSLNTLKILNQRSFFSD